MCFFLFIYLFTAYFIVLWIGNKKKKIAGSDQRTPIKSPRGDPTTPGSSMTKRRSRSKSPFRRSFRWIRSSSRAADSDDDEGSIFFICFFFVVV